MRTVAKIEKLKVLENWPYTEEWLDKMYVGTHSDEDMISNALGSSDGSFSVRYYIYNGAQKLVPLQRHINRFIGMINDGKFDSIEDFDEMVRFLDRIDHGPNMVCLDRLDRDMDELHAYEYHKAPQEIVDIIQGLDAAWREAKKTFDMLRKQLQDAIDQADMEERDETMERLAQEGRQKQMEYKNKWTQIDITHSNVKKGIVYVLTNELMPGMVKIGFTAGNPDKRAFEISEQYALPSPFVVAGYCRTNDPYIVEQRIHTSLENCRVKGEFFKIGADEALKVVNNHIIE